MYRLIVTAVSTGLISGFTIAPARASGPGGGGYGNGSHNRSTNSIKSPTYNHGYQHTSNSNAGGTNSVLNALCQRVSNCKLVQNFTIKVVQKMPAGVSPVLPFFTYTGPDGTITFW